MESLAKKVHAVETEAEQRIAAAEREGKARLAELKTGEASVLQDIRAQAERRAGGIIDEQRRSAEAEINSMKQDRQKAVKQVATSAEARRSDAVSLALRLFEDGYLS